MRNTPISFLNSIISISEQVQPLHSTKRYLHVGLTSWLTIKFHSVLEYNRLREKLWFGRFYHIGERYIGTMLDFWYWAAYWDEETKKKHKWLVREKFRNAKKLCLIDFASTYKIILPSLPSYLFFLMKKFVQKISIGPELTYLLLLSRSSKARVSLLDSTKRSLTFITVGIMNSLSKRDKKSKKSKLVRILLFKYLQKLLLFSRSIRIVPLMYRTPLFWFELIQILNSDLQPFFKDYLTNLAKTSNKRYSSRFIFPFLIFRYPIRYSKFKTRNMGRIKRKIRRKLILSSRIDI